MIYRCKNCGQRILPEVNTICPACKITLVGNIVKDTSDDKKKKGKTPLILLLLIVLTIGGLYFSGYGQKILNSLKQDTSKDLDTLISEINVNQPSIGMTNTNQLSNKLSYNVDSYFVYYDQINFGERITNEINNLNSFITSEDGVMTFDKFSNLSAEEQNKWIEEHPTEFENLN